MSFPILCIISFLALFVTDLCWAFYISRVKDHQPLRSALWAVGLFLTGAIGTISYVNDPWLLIPAAIGAFSGTFLAVLLEKKQAAG